MNVHVLICVGSYMYMFITMCIFSLSVLSMSTYIYIYIYIYMYIRIYVRHRLDTDGVGLKFPPHRLASGDGGLRASHEIPLDLLHGRSEARCKAGGVTPPDLKFQCVNLTRKGKDCDETGGYQTDPCPLRSDSL